jgi:hypothetical protein
MIESTVLLDAKPLILLSAFLMLAGHSVCNRNRSNPLLQRSLDMAKLVRIVIQLPMDLKTRLDGLKQQGYTTSGFIRAMLERELAKIDEPNPEQKSLELVPMAKRANSR